MKLIKIVERRDLISFYIDSDVAKKKQTILPQDFANINQKDDVNVWDNWLEENHFKPGVISGFKQWAYVELSLDDFINSAVVSNIFNVGYQNLADLIQSGEIKNWKPDRCVDWYDYLRGGGKFNDKLAIIMRPALPSEKSKWYIEDGNGRAICYLQRIFTYREPCKAFAYVGFDVDTNSKWIKQNLCRFFVKNKYNDVNSILMTERFKLIASVYLLFIRDGKILLLRRADTGYEDGNYGLVAGHLDAHESLTHAAIREAKEESGVDIDPHNLALVTTIHRRQSDERIDFFFIVNKWAGEPANTEPDKCDDLNWFDLDCLPANTIPYIRQAIDCYRRGVIYSEWGW